MGGDAMYPKKRPKTDREKFYEAFGKKVGCKPEQYLRRKLAGGMPEDVPPLELVPFGRQSQRFHHRGIHHH